MWSVDRKRRLDNRGASMALVSIVGGAGFIGTRLGEDLREAGHTVRAVDVARSSDPAIECRQVDVRDQDRLAEALAGSDAVYNLAAIHRDDVKPVSRYEEVNVAGAMNVCAACERFGINRLVFTSSVAVYGNAPPDADESWTPAPVSAYGQSKLRAERVHRKWLSGDSANRSLAIVRPTVVYGEGNRGNVYQFARLIATRRFAMIGDGSNRKSMAYVGNLSAFLATAVSFPPGAHTFNYVDKPDLSMEALAEFVSLTLNQSSVTRRRIPYRAGYLAGVMCDLVGLIARRSLPITANRVHKFCTTTTYSADRLSTTGFTPPVSQREALGRTIKHERASGSL